MTDTIVQRFLDAGLFDIGDEDDRLKIFHKAADDLAAEIIAHPERTVSTALVAIDPNVPDDDPVLEEAEAAVKKHWLAFRNKYSERPKGLLRPVLLEALEKAAAGSPPIVAAIWYAGANLFPHLESQKEHTIVRDTLEKMGNIAEQNAETVWAPGEIHVDLSFPKLILKFGEIPKGKIDRKSLELAMSDAAGPHNQNNEHGEDPNQTWPNSNHAWSYQFAPRATVAVANAVEKALVPLTGQAAVISEQMEPALKKFGKDFSNAISEWVVGAVGGVRQRSALIWWKETLYSPALRSSYRGLSAAEVIVGMAHDLHLIAPAPTPQSVEYFLRETLRDVFPHNPEVSISELLEVANQSKALTKVLTAVAPTGSPRRVSLLSALSLMRHTALQVDALPAWLGVRGDLKLPATELAVWLFRDAQAHTLTPRQVTK